MTIGSPVASPAGGGVEWMLRGGYPELHSRGLDAGRFFGDSLATYLERDVRSIGLDTGDSPASLAFVLRSPTPCRQARRCAR
jgi:hypothetical protein